MGALLWKLRRHRLAPVGDPVFTRITRSVRVGAPFVSFNQITSGRSSERGWRIRQEYMRVPMTSLQVWCDEPTRETTGNRGSANAGFTMRTGLAVHHSTYLPVSPL